MTMCSLRMNENVSSWRIYCRIMLAWRQGRRTYSKYGDLSMSVYPTRDTSTIYYHSWWLNRMPRPKPRIKLKARYIKNQDDGGRSELMHCNTHFRNKRVGKLRRIMDPWFRVNNNEYAIEMWRNIFYNFRISKIPSGKSSWMQNEPFLLMIKASFSTTCDSTETCEFSYRE